MNKENRISFLESVKLIFVPAVLLFLVSGCATTENQKSISDNEAVLIQSKAMIKDQNESNTVKIEIALLPRKAIRLEITGSLGISVASVLLTPSEISYAIHTTKQYATGPFNEKSLYPIFRKNIDPRILWRIINNQPMTNLNLKCSMTGDMKPSKCEATDGTTIKWTYDQPPFKRVDFISNRFEMSWIFRDQSLLGSYQNETFVLKKPDSYQEIILK